MTAPADGSSGSGVWGRLVNLGSLGNIELSGDSFAIGRSSKCEYILSIALLSGKHCRFFREQGGLVFVEDLSSNGTFVNSKRKRVGKGNKKLLRDGDTITLVLKQGDYEELSYVYYSVSGQVSGDEGGLLAAYDVGAELGSGAFAVVRVCVRRETGEQFAVKCIDKKQFALQQMRPEAMMDEVNILKTVSHPNIISIVDVFETDDMLYLVLELVSGGELFDRIIDNKCLTEDQARPLFRQMVDAVAYLHSVGIAHRDLKPENILLKSKTSNIIRISDFGLSRVIHEGSFMQTICGTPQYIAPEILDSEYKRNGYDMVVDMWSLGVILYVMLSGYFPFDDENPRNPIQDQIKAGAFSFPDKQWRNVSEDAKDLIRRCMTVNPENRISASDALSHPWVHEREGEGLASMDVDGPALQAALASMQADVPTTTATADADDPESDGDNGGEGGSDGQKRPPKKYEVMIKEALFTLKDARGSPRKNIGQYIQAHYDVPNNRFETVLKRAITRLQKKGVIAEGQEGYVVKM